MRTKMNKIKKIRFIKRSMRIRKTRTWIINWEKRREESEKYKQRHKENDERSSNDEKPQKHEQKYMNYKKRTIIK
jgi:hypothetical protein